MTSKVRFGDERNISKPSYLLLHAVWAVLGIGSALIERAIERRKTDILLLVFRKFDFVCIYSKSQHLCFWIIFVIEWVRYMLLRSRLTVPFHKYERIW